MPNPQLSPEEIREALEAFRERIPWRPQPGPQFEAFHHPADVVLYGGAAGGGKTALAVGLAITMHRETLFIRREAKQLAGVLDYIAETVDPTRQGYSSQSGEWKIPPWDGKTRKIVLGSTKNLGDELKFQGRPRDLLVVDEAANMLKEQVQFLMGWVRTTAPNQRTRTLFCSNPPTTAEGYWLIEMFAPWLDPEHPNPAKPYEIRYYITDAGEQIPVDGPEPIPNPHPVSDDDKFFYPKGYTFIPAKVGDNKYLGTDYLRELQALPEPLRSQMLYGDFTAGQDDHEYQVIPAAWVKAAMARWEPRAFENIASCAVDPSRGGRDQTVFAARSGWHYHKLRKWEGPDMDTGGKVARKVLELVGTHRCPIYVDSIGIGASVVDSLNRFVQGRVRPCVASHAASGSDWAGTLKFINKRAEMWWRFRDLLNPENGQRVSLPRDSRLLADLTAPRYTMQANGIKVESKEDIVKRLGRSPDSADAVIMAAEKAAVMEIAGYSRPRHTVEGSLG